MWHGCPHLGYACMSLKHGCHSHLSRPGVCAQSFPQLNPTFTKGVKRERSQWYRHMQCGAEKESPSSSLGSSDPLQREMRAGMGRVRRPHPAGAGSNRVLGRDGGQSEGPPEVCGHTLKGGHSEGQCAVSAGVLSCSGQPGSGLLRGIWLNISDTRGTWGRHAPCVKGVRGREGPQGGAPDRVLTSLQVLAP